jgi:hypothetical protein
MVISAHLLAPTNASLVSALANDQRAHVFTTLERERPSREVNVAIPPGPIRRTETPRLSEPEVSGQTACVGSAPGGFSHSKSIGARVHELG